MQERLSPSVRSLITERIDSVVQLEVLLLLHADPARPRTPADVAAELRIDATWAGGQLAALAAAGLLAPSGGPDLAYAYRPAHEDLGRAVAELARAYADRRVAVISFIYSKPADSLRNFADAFRLRKDKDAR